MKRVQFDKRGTLVLCLGSATTTRAPDRATVRRRPPATRTSSKGSGRCTTGSTSCTASSGSALTAEGVHAGEWLHEHAERSQHPPHLLPAWRRRTKGELRWPVTACVAVAIALQIAVPGRLVLVRPVWVLPALQGRAARRARHREPAPDQPPVQALRMASLVLVAAAHPRQRVVGGPAGRRRSSGSDKWTAGPLLITGGAIWLTNVIVFALWYWEFDRGGPVARALATKPYPDFQFVQMVSPPEMVPPDWEPAFADYLYLAFTNAAAFSPTDVLPMSRWAKVAMTVQSIISIVTVALVVSRAVNILPSG